MLQLITNLDHSVHDPVLNFDINCIKFDTLTLNDHKSPLTSTKNCKVLILIKCQPHVKYNVWQLFLSEISCLCNITSLTSNDLSWPLNSSECSQPFCWSWAKLPLTISTLSFKGSWDIKQNDLRPQQYTPWTNCVAFTPKTTITIVHQSSMNIAQEEAFFRKKMGQSGKFCQNFTKPNNPQF